MEGWGLGQEQPWALVCRGQTHHGVSVVTARVCGAGGDLTPGRRLLGLGWRMGEAAKGAGSWEGGPGAGPLRASAGEEEPGYPTEAGHPDTAAGKGPVRPVEPEGKQSRGPTSPPRDTGTAEPTTQGPRRQRWTEVRAGLWAQGGGCRWGWGTAWPERSHSHLLSVAPRHSQV